MPPRLDRTTVQRILESPDRIQEMKQLLDDGLSRIDTSIFGEGLVERAVTYRNLPMVQFLISYGVPADIVSSGGSNALYKAYKTADPRLIELIRSSVKDPEDYFALDSKIVTLGSIADSWSLQGAGVLPFTMIDGMIYVCLGKSIHDGQLTWFSGTRNRTIDVDWVDTAKREFAEETYGVFGEVELNKQMFCIHNFREVMVLLPIRCKDPIVRTVTEFKRLTTQQEIVDLVWLTAPELERLVKSDDPSIYKIVRDTLNTITMRSFITLLKKIFL